MAKSLSSIMSQIERLQREAASIQSDVVMRIRKEIAKYGLTPEQLFGVAPVRKTPKAMSAASTAAKYGDEAGNTWGGRGKRPEWLRQALAAGKALEDFLLSKAAVPAAKKRVTRKKAKPTETPVVSQPKTAAKKQVVAKKAAARKPRAKKNAAPTAAS